MKFFNRLTVGLSALALATGFPLAAQDAIESFNDVTIPDDETADDGVFVSQIGINNSADLQQSNNRQLARVSQNGNDNRANVTQEDAGDHYAWVTQDGDANELTLSQAGNGDTVLLSAQMGNGNVALVEQTEFGALGSGAAILQSGDRNNLSLTQDGTDNQARLQQNGNDNRMTAIQNGAGNQLEWVQDGDALSDLAITQSGGAQMLIVQSVTGTAITGGTD